MEFKGTKGKWVLLTGYKSYGVSIGNRSTMVFSNDCEEDKANALLISKAPEMLQELNNIVDCWDKDVFQELDIDGIRNLIKEATNI